MYSKYNKGPRQRKVKSAESLLKLLEKRAYKAIHGGPAKPILSLQAEPRLGSFRADYDTFYEYGFIKGSETWDDNDVHEWVDDVWMDIRSPYDCTGKVFTAYIGWHRNPNGIISFVHCKSIDC